MNYLKELTIFYHNIERLQLPSNAVLLWYTLMAITNKLYWKEEVPIAISLLETKTRLSRATVCRMRQILIEQGLIKYRSKGGRTCGIYQICSLESQLVAHSDALTDTLNNLGSHSDTLTDTLNDLASHSDTLTETQNALGSHSDTLTETILKHKTISISNKENIKRNLEEESKLTADSEMPLKPPELFPKEKEKSCAKKEKERKPPKAVAKFDPQEWLEKLELPWQDLMRQWLAYKKERNEFYKGKMSHDQCLNNLKKIARNDGRRAQEIINQSVANGWAGLFELREQHNYPQKQYSSSNGLPIGHVLQPRSEERRRELLESFGK